MLALARALSRRPRLLLCDELSLGLAPQVVERLMLALRDAAKQGVGLLLVEQQVHRALEVADRAYVLRHGVVELSGAVEEVVLHLDEVQDFYLTSA